MKSPTKPHHSIFKMSTFSNATNVSFDWEIALFKARWSLDIFYCLLDTCIYRNPYWSALWDSFKYIHMHSTYEKSIWRESARIPSRDSSSSNNKRICSYLLHSGDLRGTLFHCGNTMKYQQKRALIVNLVDYEKHFLIIKQTLLSCAYILSFYILVMRRTSSTQ